MDKPVESSRKVIINGGAVPVMDGGVITVQFSAGRKGKYERGTFEFWTLVGRKKAITGRSREGHSPGERFRRMQHEKGYGRMWRTVKAALYIRPSAFEEVHDWLVSHPEDFQYADAMEINNHWMRVNEG